MKSKFNGICNLSFIKYHVRWEIRSFCCHEFTQNRKLWHDNSHIGFMSSMKMFMFICSVIPSETSPFCVINLERKKGCLSFWPYVCMTHDSFDHCLCKRMISFFHRVDQRRTFQCFVACTMLWIVIEIPTYHEIHFMKIRYFIWKHHLLKCRSFCSSLNVPSIIRISYTDTNMTNCTRSAHIEWLSLTLRFGCFYHSKFVFNISSDNIRHILLK